MFGKGVDGVCMLCASWRARRGHPAAQLLLVSFALLLTCACVPSLAIGVQGSSGCRRCCCCWADCRFQASRALNRCAGWSPYTFHQGFRPSEARRFGCRHPARPPARLPACPPARTPPPACPTCWGHKVSASCSRWCRKWLAALRTRSESVRFLPASVHAKGFGRQRTELPGPVHQSLPSS